MTNFSINISSPHFQSYNLQLHDAINPSIPKIQHDLPRNSCKSAFGFAGGTDSRIKNVCLHTLQRYSPLSLSISEILWAEWQSAQVGSFFIFSGVVIIKLELTLVEMPESVNRLSAYSNTSKFINGSPPVTFMSKSCNFSAVDRISDTFSALISGPS